MTPEREALLESLAERLGHRFKDLSLLNRALTHASQANESQAPVRRDNEPLEFLGDAVLQLTVTDLLHRRDPEGNEGRKTRRRAALVKAASLARRAEALGLVPLLRLGRGEEKTGGRAKAALWADAYEAVLAALYLDGGFEAARRFVRKEFEGDLAAPDSASEDPKSELQEILQGQGRPLPAYTVLSEAGPSHRRQFKVECRLDDGSTTTGEGSSKKVAQQEAARQVLQRLRDAAVRGLSCPGS